MRAGRIKNFSKSLFAIEFIGIGFYRARGKICSVYGRNYLEKKCVLLFKNRSDKKVWKSTYVIFRVVQNFCQKKIVIAESNTGARGINWRRGIRPLFKVKKGKRRISFRAARDWRERETRNEVQLS